MNKQRINLFLLVFLLSIGSTCWGSERRFFGKIVFPNDEYSNSNEDKNLVLVHPNDIVPDTKNINYLDLLRMIFPDIGRDGQVSKLKGPLSALIKDQSVGGSYQAKTPEKLFSLPFFFYSHEGKSFIVIFYGDENDFEENVVGGVKLFALFRVSPDLKLLDSVNVEGDRFASLEKQVFWSQAQEPLFLIHQTHFNAGENYNQWQLIAVVENRLKLAYDGPFLYNFFSGHYDEKLNRDCEDSLEQKLTFAQVGSPSKGFPTLLMQVVANFKNCGQVSNKVYKARLDWDEKQQNYRGGSKELMRMNDQYVNRE